MTLRSRTGTAAVDAVRADVRVDGKGYDALVFEGRGRGRSTQGRTAGADATIAALQTASSLGHDVANLVQTLVLLAAMPAERMPREWFTDTTGRLAQLANRLKELGRPPTVTREPLALAALVQSIVAPYGGVLPGGATLVVHPIDEDLRALGDGVDLDRCILNLLLNASQATGAAGHVHLRVALEADGVVIEIRDDGPGIEDVAAVMEPYASNRPGGTGLGLPSVATAMQRMGGTLSIESQVGSGTVVRLRLTPAR
jgi:signal transduction histidine kinase